MEESSSFLCCRCFLRSSSCSFILAIACFFCSISALNSLRCFSANWISSSWNSISLEIALNSRLLRTFFCCSAYFLINSLLSSIRFFLVEISTLILSISLVRRSMRLSSPATSSSKSSTSKGSSPRTFLSSSILQSISCKEYRVLSLSSTDTSFFVITISS